MNKKSLIYSSEEIRYKCLSPNVLAVAVINLRIEDPTEDIDGLTFSAMTVKSWSVYIDNVHPELSDKIAFMEVAFNGYKQNKLIGTAIFPELNPDKYK